MGAGQRAGLGKPHSGVGSSFRTVDDNIVRETTRSDLCVAGELCLRWSGRSWPGGTRLEGGLVGAVAQVRDDGDPTRGGWWEGRD